jgi:hypothetical protein
VKANRFKSALLASVAMLGVMWAQSPEPAPPAGTETNENAADTPNRAVARISIINGVVSVRRGDSGEAVAAALNAPLTSTDRLLTGEGSRAEIQFDAANMIRLAPMTEVRLGDLAYRQYQIQIATGTTLFRVLRDNEAQIEISTPSIAVRPLKRGVYRVTVKADGSTEVTVRSGEAEIASPKGTEKLGSGKTMQARGSADNPEFQVGAAIQQDQWDQWNLQRDQDLEKSPSRGYVNPDINGTEELDANGRWVNDPQYGQVWVPTVDPGWAPYQVGRWVWVDYYGWTWVSGDPWGWAPYHYGRWYNGPYGWAWWPGALYGPYYWRPALVGFFGWGGPGFGVGFGFGFGNVGWVALAPFERFHPWYGPGFYGHGFGAVNITRNVNVSNIYRNARVSNGVTSMASNQFGRAGVNGATNIRAGAGDLARAGAVRGGMPIAPSRESTHFSNTAASSSLHSSENSHFYSSHTASASSSSASHVSFDQQRQAMTRSSAGSPAGTRSAGTGASPPSSSSSGSTSAISRRPAASSASTGSASTSPASSRSASSGSTSQAGGWQRFNGNNSGTSAGASASRPAAGSGSQPVRINPSVVQNRGSSSGSSSGSASRGAPSGGGSRGGGGSSSRGGGGGRR